MAKSPFLRRVRIQGFKSIDFCNVTLEPLTVFVGSNGSGKSNFFEAIAFIKDLLETNLAEAIRRHGGWDSILSKSSDNGQIAWEIELELYREVIGSDASIEIKNPSRAHWGFVIAKGPADQPVLIREWFSTSGGSEHEKIAYSLTGDFVSRDQVPAYRWKIQHPSVSNHQVPAPRQDRLWLSSLGAPPFARISDRLRSMAFYLFQPQAIRLPQKPTPGQLLTPDGRNLASSIETVRRLDVSIIERVKQYLKAVVREIDGFEVNRSGDFETIRFQFHRNGAGQPLEVDASCMSEGTLRVLASLMAVFQIQGTSCPSVVGIEEPETALHPAAIRALTSALDEATLRTQVLLTTHSPDLLNAEEIELEQVRVVQMMDGHTVIGPVDVASADIVRKKLDTLGGLEQQNQLEPSFEEREKITAFVPVE